MAAVMTTFTASSQKFLSPNAMDSVVETLKAQAPLETVRYVHNGEQEIRPENLKGAVGNKSWTVVFERVDDADLKSEVNKLSLKFDNLSAEVGHMKALTIPPIIANVAAQILLFLIEEQPLEPTPYSGRFRRIIQNDEPMRPKLEYCAKVLDAKWKVDSFAKAADKLLDRRNGYVHASTIEELDDMVTSATYLLDSTPSLDNLMSHEVKIIRHYEEIKAHFKAQVSVSAAGGGGKELDNIGEELDDGNIEGGH